MHAAWRGAALSRGSSIGLQQAAPGNISWPTMSQRVWRGVFCVIEENTSWVIRGSGHSTFTVPFKVDARSHAAWLLDSDS